MYGVVRGHRAHNLGVEAIVPDATVEITDGETVWTAVTDGNGAFVIEGVPAGPGYRVSVTAPEEPSDISLNGKTVYGKWIERLTVRGDGATPLAPILERGCATPIVVDAEAEGVFTPGGFDCGVSDVQGRLVVPAGGLVDGSGAPFSGNAELRLAPLHNPVVGVGDPHLESVVSMPGDLMGAADDGAEEPVLIHTYAAADVTVVAVDTGETLQLAPGAVAELTMRAWREMTDEEEILSWSYDEAQGLWIEEGTCTVDAADAQRVACELRHFSWWNADGRSREDPNNPGSGSARMPTRCVTGSVLYENEPVAGAIVSAITNEGLAGGGDVVTDSAGRFCAGSSTNGGWTVQVRMPNERVILRGSVSVPPQEEAATCTENPEDCAQAGAIVLREDDTILVRGTLGICDEELYPVEICGPMPEGGWEYGSTVRILGFLPDLITSFYLGEIQIEEDGSYEAYVPAVMANILLFTPDGYCHTYNQELPGGNEDVVVIEGLGEMICGS